MLCISISKDTRKNISQVVGVDYSVIRDYEPFEEMSMIGRKLSFSKKGYLKKVGRGNSLLARHKIMQLVHLF